ncbi:MAG: FAD-binding protein, partial [Thermoanaerobaculia bacterium]
LPHRGRLPPGLRFRPPARRALRARRPSRDGRLRALPSLRTRSGRSRRARALQAAAGRLRRLPRAGFEELVVSAGAAFESTLLWTLAALVALVVVVPYAWSFRSRRRADRARLAEARALGLDRPVAQFPFVDPTHCIGCGACVKACPEGDVLGVVGGVAVVINGLRCVGHGRCADACPVGAIEIGLGDLKSRRDVPILTDELETTVPGVFIAGELSGLALIRNAIRQGASVIETIAGRLRSAPPGPSGAADVVIVGAGPAGLAAALAAREHGLDVRVLDQSAGLGGTILHFPSRKMVLTRPVELPGGCALSREEYSKEEVLELLGEEIARRGVAVRHGERLLGIERTDDAFEVRTAAGLHRARHVVLALGRRGTPRKLGVPGEERSRVMYQLRDAESYQRQDLLVVGGGDSAVEAAIGLARQPGNRVTVSYRKDAFYRIKRKNQEVIETMLERGRVRAVFESEVESIGEREVVLRTPAGAETLANDYLFVLIGGEPPYELLRGIGVRFGGDDPPRRRTAPTAISPSPAISAIRRRTGGSAATSRSGTNRPASRSRVRTRSPPARNATRAGSSRASPPPAPTATATRTRASSGSPARAATTPGAGTCAASSTAPTRAPSSRCSPRTRGSTARPATAARRRTSSRSRRPTASRVTGPTSRPPPRLRTRASRRTAGSATAPSTRAGGRAASATRIAFRSPPPTPGSPASSAMRGATPAPPPSATPVTPRTTRARATRITSRPGCRPPARCATPPPRGSRRASTMPPPASCSRARTERSPAPTATPAATAARPPSATRATAPTTTRRATRTTAPAASRPPARPVTRPPPGGPPPSTTPAHASRSPARTPASRARAATRTATPARRRSATPVTPRTTGTRATRTTSRPASPPPARAATTRGPGRARASTTTASTSRSTRERTAACGRAARPATSRPRTIGSSNASSATSTTAPTPTITTVESPTTAMRARPAMRATPTAATDPRRRSAVLGAALGFGLLASLLAPGSAAAAAEAGRPISVAYVSAGAVYLDAGRAEGLVVGAVVRVVRGGEKLAELEVDFVAEHSSSCKVISLTRELRKGDLAVIVSLPEGAEAGPAPAPPAATVPEPTVPPVIVERYTEELPERGRTRVHGSAALGYRTLSNTGGASSNETGGRLSLRLSEIAGRPLELRVRARGREVSRDGYGRSVDSSQRLDRLYELSLAWEPEDSRLSLRLGRLGAGPFLALGYLDGALAQVRLTRHLYFGAFGGARPDLEELGFDTAGSKYGGYFRYAREGEPGGGYAEIVLGGVTERAETGDVSRDYVTVESRFGSGARWWFFQRAEIDLNRGWREQASGKTSEISNAALSASFRLSESLRASVSYDQRRNFLTWETRPLPEEVFTRYFREGGRVALDWQTRSGWSASLGGGLERADDVDDPTDSYYLSLLRANAFGAPLLLGGDASLYRGGTAEGWVANLRARWSFRRGHDLGLTLGASEAELAGALA